MKKYVLGIGVFLLGTLLLGATYSFKNKPKKIKKVIFIIGDGMGLAQISGALSHINDQNAFERFPVIGLSKTSSADNYVTDSGAGATVFAIGKKTFNYAISVGPDSLPYPSLFEMMKKKKMATGVVVTSSITHATPACFYSHVSSRKSEDDIAEFLLQGNCDIAIGGGTKFLNANTRADGRDLNALLQRNGFMVKTDTSNNFTPILSDKLVYTLAFNGMKRKLDGRDDYLRRASLATIQQLNHNKNGYMLMIEGSQVDWGGHDNNFEYMKTELIDLNQTINAVLDYAQKEGDILVVVTADHETGGLALNENKENKSTFKVSYSTGGHSGIMVPVFAFGPGSELFSGIYENTAIHYKFKQLLGLE
ncbi:MAG: alkaline phosphatase [Bacteroidota bacterium]